MAVFKCKMCGGQLEIGEASRVGTCEYCGTEQTLPRLDSDKKANMYNRANHFRRNNDYDKAMSLYEQILNEDNTDSEAYWSLVLCRYGIEYVEDPVSHKRIPTVNRAQFVSIYADEDYKSAIEYADESQKVVYEQEAKTIENIQRGILAISEKEEPFDIFICYKETDDAGKRTPDSVLANDLYHQLTQEGFKVFFARITLEDKLGQEYEPYIFAALHSAKVMIALGTKPEHFNAVWVKNEWSRYISLISSGEKKMLIPAYKDMDPYDLPEEFSHLQAQDMSKLGFVQDIIRGIKKIIRPETQQTVIQKETVVVNSQGVPAGNYTALLKRGNIALDDGEWEKADGFFEEVLNQNAECAEAYLGKMLVKYEKRNIVAFITYLEEKYSEFEAEELIACEDDTEHIIEILNTYVINNYLHEEDIAPLYEFDRKYISTIKSVEAQKENALAELQNDKLFIRARQYATGETVKVIDSLINSISSIYDKKIKEISDNDSQIINSIKKAYEAHIADADMTVKEMHSRAMKELETDYQQSIENYNNATTISDYKNVKNDFDNYAGYKESAQYIKQCNDNMLRIRDEQIAKEKRISKIKKIAAIVVAAISVLAITAYFVATQIIIPESKYSKACELQEAGSYDEAIEAFTGLNGYKDADEKVKEVQYQKAEQLLAENNINGALELFSLLGDYNDALAKVAELKYAIANQLYEAKDYANASNIYAELGDYLDSAEKLKASKYIIAKALLKEKKYDDAIAIFTELGKYESSKELIKKANYNKAKELMAAKKYDDAKDILEKLGKYKESKELIKKIDYINAEKMYKNGLYEGAERLYKKLGNYKDSKEKLNSIPEKMGVDTSSYRGAFGTIGSSNTSQSNSDNDDYYDSYDDSYDDYDTYDYYVIPYSSDRLLTEYDLEGLSAEELRIARNEIYARNGRRFQDEELQRYFDSMEWYDGFIEPEDFDENELLTQTERDNTRFIKQFE